MERRILFFPMNKILNRKKELKIGCYFMYRIPFLDNIKMMKSEQSITELETSFHYHVLLDHASPFPEEKEEENRKYTIDNVEEELNTFYLFEHSSAPFYWCIFFGTCVLVIISVVCLFL